IQALADVQGRFQAANISQSLNALTESGAVVKAKDGKDVWWAISQAELAPKSPPAPRTRALQPRKDPVREAQVVKDTANVDARQDEPVAVKAKRPAAKKASATDAT